MSAPQFSKSKTVAQFRIATRRLNFERDSRASSERGRTARNRGASRAAVSSGAAASVRHPENVVTAALSGHHILTSARRFFRSSELTVSSRLLIDQFPRTPRSVPEDSSISSRGLTVEFAGSHQPVPGHSSISPRSSTVSSRELINQFPSTHRPVPPDSR
jgi:hypothetical protein